MKTTALSIIALVLSYAAVSQAQDELRWERKSAALRSENKKTTNHREDPPAVKAAPMESVVLPELIVSVNKKKTYVPLHKKVYVCGEPHSMNMGPVDKKVRDCEWK